MWILILLLSVTGSFGGSHVYHTFNASELTPEQLDGYTKQGAREFCTITVEDCVESDYRRLDGTCNTLNQKSRGGTRTPLRRWLPPSYDNVADVRKAKSGNPLPNSRVIRTEILLNGRSSSNKFTTLATNKISFMAHDVFQPPDAENYISAAPYCCSAEGQTNANCRAIQIPEDDPVLRFSGHRCMNYTRPLTYQDNGCLEKGSSPEVSNQATPAFDLSQIYGIDDKSTSYRQSENGLLKSEEVEGRIWPPKIEDPNQANSYCVQNRGYDSETRCHDTPFRSSNEDLGTNLFTIWYWRLHNSIAKQLADLNPCWDDTKLFNVARDINIAFSVQVYFYELLPTLFGRENLLKDEIIIDSAGFREVYKNIYFPQITYEYAYALRYIHTIQEGKLKLYNAEGAFVKSFPAVNMTYRTGHLALGENLDLFTQGSFRQSSANIDNVIDPDFGERAYGAVEEITDIAAVDIEKGRDMGISPYVTYRQKIGGETIASWDDLAQIMNSEHVQRLQAVYESVEDVDAIVGMWAEKPMNNSAFPQTLYGMLAEDLKFHITTDRHWYEREKRPNAFTPEQLAVIRKATVAGLLCTVGDKVTQIQQNAFLVPGAGNEMKPCAEIPQLDLTPWKIECPKPAPPPAAAPPPEPQPEKKKEGFFKKAWRKVKSIF